MTAIERAEALLTMADAGGGCTNIKGGRDQCPSCSAGAALSQIMDGGGDFLRGYIGAVKVIGGLMEIAETAMPDSYFRSDRRTKKARKTIADFERLFPEAPQEQPH